jgi:hypothetical protein
MGKKEKKNPNFKITNTLLLQKYKVKNHQYISSYPTFLIQPGQQKAVHLNMSYTRLCQ